MQLTVSTVSTVFGLQWTTF